MKLRSIFYSIVLGLFTFLPNPAYSDRTVTDGLGRVVTLPDNIERLIDQR